MSAQHPPTDPQSPADAAADAHDPMVIPADHATTPDDGAPAEQEAAPEHGTPAEQEATPDDGAPAEQTTAPAEQATEADSHARPPAPKPAPKPVPVPKPSMLARRPGGPAVPTPPPGTPTPASSPAASTAEPVGGAEAPLDPDEVAAAKAFGRVDDEGTVYLQEAGSERVVGQYPGVSKDEALGLYIRRYVDLRAQVQLFAARLGQLGPKDLDSTLASLTDAVAEPAVVGDTQALRDQVAALRDQVEQRKAEITAERAAAKEEALQVRTGIVEQAEKIAAREPHRIQWRQEGQRLRELLEQWKHAQRTGPRLDRGTEDALWKRFSAARTQFDRVRRQYFAELDRTHAEVKVVKEKLIARAEALSSSTDWGPTSGAYRDLMDEWKRAGRASRKDDDALWARFRAAQDVFFEARKRANQATDAQYAENLKVKEQLLTEAEALLPVKNLEKAKSSLRDIQERWEDAGKVPRADIGRVEGRMRAVEQAIRDVEQAQWDRSNPRVRARAEGAAAQLESAIAALEQDLADARASGDERAIARATEALQARQAWLEQVLRAADDAR